MQRLVMLFLFIFTLAACGAQPTATPDIVATQVAQAQAVAATLTAAVPTATPTPVPTDTTTPTATNTPAPTLSPTPRPTRAPTHTPRPSRTPTPTPLPALGTKENPLPFGEVGVFNVHMAGTPMKIQLQVTEVIRGNQAARLIEQNYGYCDTMQGDQECVVVRTVLDYLEGPEDDPQGFGMIDFAFETDRGTFIPPGSVGVGKVLPYMYGKGYPPLHVDGWNKWEIRNGAELPYLVFWPGLLVARDMGIDVPLVYMSLTSTEEQEPNQATPRVTTTSANTVAPTLPPTKTPTPTASMQLLADSQADFTGGQGQNSWEYLFSEGRDSFNWKQMSFDGSCYRSPFAEEQMRICPDHGAPGAGGDIAWLYKAEASGTLLFKVTAKKTEAHGDDIEIKVYRHTEDIKEWDLYEGNTAGFTKQFEVNANGGEMFFFTMQVQSIWREFQYDPNVFRVQVYLKE